MSEILVLNGPNLNMLGIREPGHYGSLSLDKINSNLVDMVSLEQVSLTFFQSNSEAELIDKIHHAYNKIDFIIFNPAAFTHTSIALRDAMTSVNIPFIELHLSNVHCREEFRHKSYFSSLAEGVISGLGAKGYELALQYAMHYLQNNHLKQDV